MSEPYSTGSGNAQVTRVKPRNFTVDLLKKIASMGVVFIHTGGSFLQYSGVPASSPGSQGWLVAMLIHFCRFGVPVFIVFWAYYYELGLQRNPAKWTYSRQRFIHLFKVFFFWSLIYFLITVDWHTINIKTLITSHWSGYGWAGQYYFIIVFQLMLFFPLLRWFARSPVWIAIIFIGTIGLYLLYLLWMNRLPGSVMALGYRPFFFWAAYCLVAIWLTRLPRRRVSITWLLLLAVLPLEFLLINSAGLAPLAYITPAVLVAAFAIAPYLLQPPQLPRTDLASRFVGFGSNNTFTVFVINSLFVMFLPWKYIWQAGSPMNHWLVLALNLGVSAMVYLLCLGAALLINRSPLKGIAN